MNNTYVILSLKWSKPGSHAVWWGPNNSGYVCDFDHAGHYTKEQIEKAKHYYDNGVDTRAVPASIVEEHLRRVADFNHIEFATRKNESCLPSN